METVLLNSREESVMQGRGEGFKSCFYGFGFKINNFNDLVVGYPLDSCRWHCLEYPS